MFSNFALLKRSFLAIQSFPSAVDMGCPVGAACSRVKKQFDSAMQQTESACLHTMPIANRVQE